MNENGMVGTTDVLVRVATLGDAEAVGQLLKASYSVLMGPGYDPEVLAHALPLMTMANLTLLASGTWYVAELQDADGHLVGCGGWTLARPGAPEEPIDPELAHIRHFATHPARARLGVGRAVFERCLADAGAVGVQRFECYSSLGAEPFYTSLGFKAIAPLVVNIGNVVSFPSIRMIYELPRAKPRPSRPSSLS